MKAKEYAKRFELLPQDSPDLKKLVLLTGLEVTMDLMTELKDLHRSRGGSSLALPGVVREINQKWNAIIKIVNRAHPEWGFVLDRDQVSKRIDDVAREQGLPPLRLLENPKFTRIMGR